MSGGEETRILSQNVGFQFRYRANVNRKKQGSGKSDDDEEQTLEIEGAGYSTMDQAVEASRRARSHVWKILEEKPEGLEH